LQVIARGRNGQGRAQPQVAQGPRRSRKQALQFDLLAASGYAHGNGTIGFRCRRRGRSHCHDRIAGRRQQMLQARDQDSDIHPGEGLLPARDQHAPLAIRLDPEQSAILDLEPGHHQSPGQIRIRRRGRRVLDDQPTVTARFRFRSRCH